MIPECSKQTQCRKEALTTNIYNLIESEVRCTSVYQTCKAPTSYSVPPSRRLRLKMTGIIIVILLIMVIWADSVSSSRPKNLQLNTKYKNILIEIMIK